MAGDYDIAVIGGGINGAGIARDAALRGLRVILLEKDDFGSGTSSASSRLIHGGLRYLEYGEIPLVYESLHERQHLRIVAPHLVSVLKLNIPIYAESRRGRFVIRLGMLAYDLLSLGKRLPGHRMLSRDELLGEEPGLRRDGLKGGAQYFDGQVTYAERLVLENVLGAAEAGAEVRNYCPVIGITVRGGRIDNLQFVDSRSGEECEIRPAVIVNAAGPWVDRVLNTVNREMPKYMGGTKGSHIVVGRFDGAPDSAFYVEAQADGRPFFIIPWNGQYLIGTTDIRCDEDPDDVVAGADEIDYLLGETNRVFPSAALGRDDIHFVYAGVRPLPRREHGPESAITRKHIIMSHRRQASGLFSIIGGKLTTYRHLAEQAVDKASRYLKRERVRCTTHSEPLPGAVGLDGCRRALAAASPLSAACVGRLTSIYGSRAADIVALARQRESIEYLDEEETVLAAEVPFALRHEFAENLTDLVYRRLMTGLSADQGAGLNRAIARLAAGEQDWSEREHRRQLERLQEYSARMRPPPPDS